MTPQVMAEIEECHRLGMHFWLHSCGNNFEILDDLIEVGDDVFHPVQKHTMDERETARRFDIPVHHFYDLIRGMEMDLAKTRYQTFDELKEYCYHVASSVGLMCLGIFGSKDARTREYAVNLGIALQMTNILRDVGADATYGRIYLPLEDLRRFGLREEDILARRRKR